MKKPHFIFISKKKFPKYNDCYACNQGSVREVRWYEPNIYYTTIQGFSQKFEILAEAIRSNFLYN